MLLNKISPNCLVVYSVVLIFLLISKPNELYAQVIDLKSLMNRNKIKLNGNISANGVYFNSDDDTGKQPFTYFLQGNLNLSYGQFSIPLSYSYSNLGSQLNYQIPFDFNRLSLHPRYKFIQAYIGDSSMSFSPLTLNGIQFKGFGIEVKPPKGFQISLMCGALSKAIEPDQNPKSQAAFSRMGYGAKLIYQKTRIFMGSVFFMLKITLNHYLTHPMKKEFYPKKIYLLVWKLQFIF